MLKVTKFQAKEFKKLAKVLPVVYYEVKEKRSMLGADIIKNKSIDQSRFKTIDPDKKYLIETNVRYPVNHHNRITTAYQNAGMKAVEEYCQQTQELVLKNLTPIPGLTMVE